MIVLLVAVFVYRAGRDAHELASGPDAALRTAIETYHHQRGSYPRDLDALRAAGLWGADGPVATMAPIAAPGTPPRTASKVPSAARDDERAVSSPPWPPPRRRPASPPDPTAQ